jgi:hypothetical protein
MASVTLYQGSGQTAGNSGSGVRGGSYGNNNTQGTIVIYYLGSQKGSGGTVTNDGTYTYHRFTSAGTYYP